MVLMPQKLYWVLEAFIEGRVSKKTHLYQGLRRFVNLDTLYLILKLLVR